MAYRGYKGKYKHTYREKYKGNPTNIIYRSLWERKLMVWLDNNRDVLQWSSEEIAIPYRSPVDRKMHRYYPDFWAKIKNYKGIVENILIEVKPKRMSQKPKPPLDKRKKRTYIKEAKRWSINEAKWEAAMNYCEDRGWKFQVLTEDTLVK